jgi:methylmalonyl-CoA/ethylmalonyl-CoA epimerase
MNRIDHIGYLTDSIEASLKTFMPMGYESGEIFHDDTQRCRICFASKAGEVRMELVEPYADNRSMQKMLQKQGCGPYHVCYVVDDIDAAYNNMTESDFMPLFSPVAAPAFGGRRICYFYKREIGYFEIVESEKE